MRPDVRPPLLCFQQAMKKNHFFSRPGAGHWFGFGDACLAFALLGCIRTPLLPPILVYIRPSGHQRRREIQYQTGSFGIVPFSTRTLAVTRENSILRVTLDRRSTGFRTVIRGRGLLSVGRQHTLSPSTDQHLPVLLWLLCKRSKITDEVYIFDLDTDI